MTVPIGILPHPPLHHTHNPHTLLVLLLLPHFLYSRGVVEYRCRRSEDRGKEADREARRHRQTGKQGKEHTNKKGIQVKEYWHRKKEL